MYYQREQTPYTRRQDASLISLVEPTRAKQPEHKPTTSSDISLREKLQWVRLDMEIRLFAERSTEMS